MDGVSKGTMKVLAGAMNEHAAGAGPSAWARKLLERQGWAEGKGLGKKEDGMVSHIKVAKKDDTAALGFKEAAMRKETADNWFFGTFDAALGGARIGGAAAVDGDGSSSSSSDESDGGDRRARAGKKRARDGGRASRGSSSSSSSSGSDAGGGAKAPAGAPDALSHSDAFYAALFKATGGARLGMRARADQRGKWERAERAAAGAGGAAGAATAAGDGTLGADEARQKKQKKEREEKKDKKEKKERKEKSEKKEKKKERKEKRKEKRNKSGTG
jgi:hypothetical protein